MVTKKKRKTPAKSTRPVARARRHVTHRRKGFGELTML